MDLIKMTNSKRTTEQYKQKQNTKAKYETTPTVKYNNPEPPLDRLSRLTGTVYERKRQILNQTVFLLEILQIPGSWRRDPALQSLDRGSII